MGVHVEGGFPNTGSVIGPAGNEFGDYILALAVLSGETSTRACKVDSKTRFKLSAPGYSLIRVEPEALKESAESTTDLNGHASASDKSGKYNSEDRDTDKDKDSEDGHGDQKGAPVSGGGKSLLDKQIDSLWGRHPAEPSKQFDELSVMHFPESLQIKESDGQDAPPTTDQILEATKKAVEHPDVQTTFFVNFLPGGKHDPERTKKLNELKSLVQSWQAWSSSMCESNLQQQINKKALSAGDEGQFARSTYRAKVFDFLFRQATW